MPYVKPGASAQLFPGGPSLGFPLGGYVGDVFGNDPTVFNLIVYTPSAVTGNARQVGVLYLPDHKRWKKPKPAKGWPLLCVNAGGGQGTWAPRLNVVPDEMTSNLAYQALEHGWAVWWTSIAGPNGGYPSAALGHGTEDIVARTGQGFLPADYEHYEGPGSLPLLGGTEYAHDKYLTYRKQGQWQVQFARMMGATGQWPINPDMLASAGISWGGDVSIAQHAMPDLVDPAMNDLRKYSSRVQMAGALVPPFWLPALIANEGNVYGYQLPRATAPLTDDCHLTGWIGAPSPSGLIYAQELSLERAAFGRYAVSDGVGERWPGAPTHAELIEQTKYLRLFVASSDEPFNYSGRTPTQFCAMAGTGFARSLTDFGKMTCSVPGQTHSPAWQVQMAQRFYELDGSTAPTGFQRTHTRFVLPEAVYDLLAGHTTTNDGGAPYSAIPLQDFPWLIKEEIEDTVGGLKNGFVGYLGTAFVAWLEAEALDIDPNFRDPTPELVLPRTPYTPPAAAGFGGMQGRLLPPGFGWGYAPTSNVAKLLDACGEEMSRVAQRLADLHLEADPSKTTELLSDWEQLLALPDPCLTEELTIAKRREAIVAKLGLVGGQSPAFLVELAKALGYEVEVEEYFPLDCSSGTCVDPLYTEEWLHHFAVKGPGNTIVPADCVNSSCVDPLNFWGNEPLFCAIARAKPAHTHVLFLEH